MKKKFKYNPAEVRFTKVLTKYSTEFNAGAFGMMNARGDFQND